MTFDPNASWNTARQRPAQQPVYFLRFVNAAEKVWPIAATSYGSDSQWSNPALAYDGSDLTGASGCGRKRVPDQTYASQVFTFQPGTLTKIVPKVALATGTVSGKNPGPFFVEAYYSTDGGGSWHQIGSTLTSGAALLEGPTLTNVAMGSFRLRIRTWTTNVVGTESGVCYSAYVSNESNAIDYSTSSVQGSTVLKKPYLTEIEYEGGAVDIIEGSMTIGTVRVTLVDADGDLVQLLGFEADQPLWRHVADQRIDLFAGYREMQEVDFVRIFRGRISEVSMTDDLSGIMLVCEDVKAGLKQNVMELATDPPDPDNPQDPEPPGPVVLQGNAINVLGAILLGRFADDDPDFPVTVLSGQPTGCNLDPDLDVNVDALKNIRDTWLDGFIIRTEWRDGVDAAKWAGENVFQIFGPVGIDGYGRITMFPWEPPVRPAIPATLTDDDVLSVVSWRLRTDIHKNAVRIQYNYDPVTKDYAGLNLNEPDEAVVQDDADIAAVGVRRELLRQSDGLRWYLRGYTLARDRAAKILRWLKKPPVELTVSVPFTRGDLEVGDVVSVTLSTVPDVTTGLRGILNRPMRIVSVVPNVAEGTFEMVLFEFGYQRYGLIAPDSVTADYDGWTQDQKDRYVALADDATETVGSGGDRPYRVI